MTQRRVLQVWLTECKDGRTCEENSLLQERSRIRVFKNVQGNLPQKIQKSSSTTTRSSCSITAYLVLTFHTSRKSTRICDNNSVASQQTKMEERECFVTVTLQAAIHLGNDYLDNFHSTKNQPQRTVQQLFDVTRKLVRDQTEIQGTSMINWQEYSWNRTTMMTYLAVRLATATADVFSDGRSKSIGL